MVVATPSFILSGFTWPLSQMPEWIQYIAAGIPLTHFLKAFRILLVENGNISQTIPAVMAMLWIAVICGIGSVIALYFKRKQVKHFEEETVLVPLMEEEVQVVPFEEEEENPERSSENTKNNEEE